MKLNIEEVKKVAKLAALPITESEVGKYSEQLSAILDYVEELNQVDTENVLPIYNTSGNLNVLGKDEVEESLSQEKATQNGSNIKDGYFVTKGVFSDE